MHLTRLWNAEKFRFDECGVSQARIGRSSGTNDARNHIFRHVTAQRSSVLHYAIWDPHALWAKYHLHGDFPDAIVGANAKGGM